MDHLDFECIRALILRDDPKICIPLGCATLLWQQGMCTKNVIEMDWYTSYKFNEDIQIFFEPAYHWSGRNFVFDKNKRLWGSFLIKTTNGTIFFSCDTDCFDGEVFKNIHKKFAPIQFAFLSIGGYKPHILWGHSHADPCGIMNIHNILDPEWSVFMHYDTFQRLGDEKLKEPENAIKKLETAKNVPNFKWLPIGQSWDVPQKISTKLS